MHVGHEALLDPPAVLVQLVQELQLVIVAAAHGGALTVPFPILFPGPIPDPNPARRRLSLVALRGRRPPRDKPASARLPLAVWGRALWGMEGGNREQAPQQNAGGIKELRLEDGELGFSGKKNMYRNVQGIYLSSVVWGISEPPGERG